MKNLLLVLTVVIAVFFAIPSASASNEYFISDVKESFDFPSQTITYVNKTGTVYSANPGTSTFKATTDEVTIRLSKTGGKAETQVNIYVNNSFKAKMEFDNGNYTRTLTRTLKGVKNKTIKIKIVNQSVANKFQYRLLCTGVKPPVSQCPKVVQNFSGTVYAAGPKNFTIKPKCNKLEIKVAKTGGKAETQVNVYINNQFQQAYKMEFDNGNYTRTITRTLQNVKNKTVKVTIVNQSIANKFQYRFTATQKN